MRFVNVCLHWGKFAFMLYAFFTTGSGKIAPEEVVTPMDTMVTCGNIYTTPFGDKLIVETCGQVTYAFLQVFMLARFWKETKVGIKVARFLMLLQAVSHARSHWISASYDMSWDTGGLAVQSARDESTNLLNVMSFSFLLVMTTATYLLVKASKKEQSNAWLLFPVIFTGSFLYFYFNLLPQQDQYYFMGELVNVIALAFAESSMGQGFKEQALVEDADWNRYSHYVYAAYISMGLSQWIEHRWCREFLAFEPHFWFDMTTFATFEAALLAINREFDIKSALTFGAESQYHAVAGTLGSRMNTLLRDEVARATWAVTTPITRSEWITLSMFLLTMGLMRLVWVTPWTYPYAAHYLLTVMPILGGEIAGHICFWHTAQANAFLEYFRHIGFSWTVAGLDWALYVWYFFHIYDHEIHVGKGVIDFWAFYFLEALFFYLFHRIEHIPVLYTLSHHIHHAKFELTYLDGDILHLVDTLFNSKAMIVPAMISYYTCGYKMDLWSWYAFLFIRQFITTDCHSSDLRAETLTRRMPFYMDRTFHRSHHREAKDYNFGYLSIWEELFRTYKAPESEHGVAEAWRRRRCGRCL
eukprot:NODE_3514_length_2024_cov_28.545071.p1 GENE.NODE_3514_length_2024_cov_28.545071~~NODE_3514_length_2024_cov_28.545071.p1  ORF type:complete len:639 (+),score=122.53 NODE_3514_length_2024_cov_28.545071:166-1917(+)